MTTTALILAMLIVALVGGVVGGAAVYSALLTRFERAITRQILTEQQIDHEIDELLQRRTEQRELKPGEFVRVTPEEYREFRGFSPGETQAEPLDGAEPDDPAQEDPDKERRRQEQIGYFS